MWHVAQWVSRAPPHQTLPVFLNLNGISAWYRTHPLGPLYTLDWNKKDYTFQDNDRSFEVLILNFFDVSGLRELLIINKNVIKHLHLKTSLFGQLSKTRFNPWVHSGSQLSQIKQNYNPFRFDYAIKCIIHQKCHL